MADVVLIHGTIQAPSGWDRLVAALESRGHRAVAVDLAGGDHFDRCADIVTAQVPDDLRAPVVVAHSGTAPLLPEVARRLGARHQVWLASIIPDGRRSFVEEISGAPADIFYQEWLGQDPTTDPVLAAYFMFHDCDLETLRWALTTVRLFPPTDLYAEDVTLAPEIPSTYILGSRDRVLRPGWSRREAVRRLDAEVVEMDAGHCPHVSKPDDLADILARL